MSAVGRSITAPNNYTITGAIQTDAAINPGNSGGPLLDANAHVLGLNDQIQTNSGSSAGVGFAIPSNTVPRIAERDHRRPPVKHSYVGVELDPNSTGGAQIGSSGSARSGGSPAPSAGPAARRHGHRDQRQAITSTEQFIATVDSYPPGRRSR